MANVFSVQVSTGGLPAHPVVFARARKLAGGRILFTGYFSGPEDSYLRKSENKVSIEERRKLGLEQLDMEDRSGAGKRDYFKIMNLREDRIPGERDISIFSLERLKQLRDFGYPLFAGALGENITTEGLDHAELTSGALICIGVKNKRGVVLKTIEPEPCATIEAYAKIASKMDNDGNEKSHLLPPESSIKPVALTIWYCSIEDVWGTGIVKPLDSLEIMK